MIPALLADNPGPYHVMGPSGSGLSTLALRWAAAANKPSATGRFYSVEGI